MPIYSYTARNLSGDLVTGRLKADSQRSAIEEIRRLGCVPINVETGGALKTGARAARGNTAALLSFTKQLARLLEAGVPLARALELLSSSSQDSMMKPVAAAVHEDIRGGAPLHEALAAHPGVFPDLYQGMVRSGEASGTLTTVLRRLADHYEKQRRLAAQIWNAITYPLFMLGIGFITITFLIAVVIPRFQKVFEDLGQVLPLPTRILMGAGAFTSANWWIFLAAAIFIAFAVKSVSSSSSARAAMHGLILNIPALGRLVKRAAAARFTRVLGTLLLNGVPILQAIELASSNTGNMEVSRRLKPVLASTREGVPLAASFRRSGLFDPFTIDITTIAEETGTLPLALVEIADHYDEDNLTELQRLTSILEPALIAALGVVVAFVVSAMLLPILQLNLSSL